jgi:hypothetical protein
MWPRWHTDKETIGAPICFMHIVASRSLPKPLPHWRLRSGALRSYSATDATGAADLALVPACVALTVNDLFEVGMLAMD